METVLGASGRNPYIDDYYKDIPMGSQYGGVLSEAAIQESAGNSNTVKRRLSRTAPSFEGVYVLRANNRKMGNMDQRD